MDRYSYPLWFECKCPIGVPVCRSTMLLHRSKANKKRRIMHRGLFGWGPKVSDSSKPFHFDNFVGILEHDTEDDLLHTTSATSGKTSLLRSVNGDDTFMPSLAESWHDEYDGDNGDRALKSADADPQSSSSSSSSDEMQAGTRIEGLRNWLTEEREWVMLFSKHGLEESVMNYILKLKLPPFKSWKTVISYIARASGLGATVEMYSDCPGHMCFASLTDQQQPVSCCSERVKEKVGHNDVSYIPLLPRISAMVCDKQICTQLHSYRHERIRESNLYADIYDGAAYKRLCHEYGEDSMAFDVFISISVDGFQPFNNKSYEIWFVLAIILNLPPNMRYSTKKVLPLMFIPGPRGPRNLESYLVPLVSEVKNIHCNGGVLLRFYDNVFRKIRVHILAFQGDPPAVSKMAGLCGHRGRHPCRSCSVHGVFASSTKGYYFPSRMNDANGKTNILYNPKCLPTRTKHSIPATFKQIQVCKNQTQQRLLARNTGIKRQSILCTLPSVLPYRSFPHDTMHLFYNIQKELLRLHTSEWEDAFVLRKTSLECMDVELLNCGSTISGQFILRRPRPLTTFTSWKVTEHKSFTLSYCLVLFDGYLSKQYMDGLADFVEIVDICSRSSLTHSDAERVRILSLKFLLQYDQLYYRLQKDRLQMCKSVFHMLLHLSDTIIEYGPLVCIYQFCMERSTGWNVNRLNARTLVAASMTRSAMFGEAFRMFYRVLFVHNDEHFNETVAEGGYKLLGPKRVRTVAQCCTDDRLISRIARYLSRKLENMNINQAKRIAAKLSKYCKWSRIRFFAGGKP